MMVMWLYCVGSCLWSLRDWWNTFIRMLQSFNVTHPGKVKYYIVDDYANSDCNYLNSWNGSYQLSPDATFSNPSY